MAKVLNPLNSSEARGRVGGLVYNTWRGIRTVKTHTDPGHQDDPLRHAHFEKIRDAGKRWATIGDDLRASWNHFANAHPQIDWTGRPVRLAGFHWYVRIQVTLQDIQQAYNDTPPTEPCTCTPLALAIESIYPSLYLSWTIDPLVPVNTYDVQCFLTRPHSAGRHPTLHDAYLYDYTFYETGYAWVGPLPLGIYTVFARPIHWNGMIGNWARITEELIE